MTVRDQAQRKRGDKQSFLDSISSGASALSIVPDCMIKERPKLYFRADSRTADQIFAHGFQPREPGDIVYRLMQQDVHPSTAVCVSSRFDAAALFPLKVDPKVLRGAEEVPEMTTVYVVFARRVFNTQRLQARFAANSIAGQGVAQRDAAFRNLFAYERAALEVDAADVLAAVNVHRRWSGRDFLAGGTYSATACALNDEHANLSKHGREIDALRNAIADGKLLNYLQATSQLAMHEELDHRRDAKVIEMLKKYRR